MKNQEGLFPASASVLIILAEFSRVFLLSDSSARYLIIRQSASPGEIFQRFSEDAENVITRVEDEKTQPEEEHEKQVMKT